MKITNLITILEAIKAKHGDINLVLTNCTNSDTYNISHISVSDEFDVMSNGHVNNTATLQINYEN